MSAAANPQAFSARGTLAIVVAGLISFVVLLGWLGTGAPRENNGGAHAMGKGIAGYAALAAMLGAEGHSVRYNRAPKGSGDAALMVLTPPHEIDPKDIALILDRRRAGIGPTLLILPKWQTEALPSDPRVDPRSWRARLLGPPKAPAGWTAIVGARGPQWHGVLDKIGVSLGAEKGPAAHGWMTADGVRGPLADDHRVLAGGGTDDEGAALVPLVRSGDGRILAGYFADGGSYPALEQLAGTAVSGHESNFRPLVVVFEPDLFNNRGMATRETALLADRLIAALAPADDSGAPADIEFDLALDGLGAPRNLLTLAFTPPFLAATICLLVAVAGAVWSGFVRFGPSRDGAPAARVGRIALVSGGARLLLRARRHHLLTRPYADAVRERLLAALALPRAQADAAIERIQATRAPGTRRFSLAVARLEVARQPATITAAAAELHTIEQALIHASPSAGPQS